MAQPSRKNLPMDVATHLNHHRDALAAIANGDDRTDDAVQAADAAVRAAWAHAHDEPDTGFGEQTFTATFEQIIAERLAETRAEAGWTQAQLAEAAAPYANWTRFTVAEIESGRRGVKLEELVMLASLYGEPILSFLVPTDQTSLELDHVNVNPGVLAELFVGRGGAMGTGGRSWAAAARVATEPGSRPAPDLWANRSQRDRRTQPSSSKQSTGARSKKGKS